MARNWGVKENRVTDLCRQALSATVSLQPLEGLSQQVHLGLVECDHAHLHTARLPASFHGLHQEAAQLPEQRCCRLSFRLCAAFPNESSFLQLGSLSFCLSTAIPNASIFQGVFTPSKADLRVGRESKSDHQLFNGFLHPPPKTLSMYFEMVKVVLQAEVTVTLASCEYTLSFGQLLQKKEPCSARFTEFYSQYDLR